MINFHSASLRFRLGCLLFAAAGCSPTPPVPAAPSVAPAPTSPVAEPRALEPVAPKMADPAVTPSNEPDAAVCPTGFVQIKKGTFIMGSSVEETGREDDEVLHAVTLTHPYCLQTTEVTLRAWAQVMGSRPINALDCGDECPVQMVNWEDAIAYANALSRREGLPACYDGETFAGLRCAGYRLPTEAEWEHAARAGSPAPTYGEVDAVAWHRDNCGGTPHVVAQKLPNAWGLYDMLGNVSEWTGDRAGPYASVDEDPLGPLDGDTRVNRGGSWFDYAPYARAAFRSYDAATDHSITIGFRLAKSVP